MTKRSIYRLNFISQDKAYEIYARKICESEMFGFLEVEEFIFGEKSSLVVDPSEERLKMEFTGVIRSYIPLHSITRIDEVEKEGISKVKGTNSDVKTNISMFPGVNIPKKEDK